MSGIPPYLQEDAVAARAVMRGVRMAVLATAQRDAGGWPCPTLVQVAFDLDATPLLLISGLAEHTRNLLQDPRAGLLFDGTAGLAEPLTGPRVSLLGRMERTDDARLLRRFLARHPAAEQYAGFGDFSLWRLRPERGHMVAGFGRIRRLPADYLQCPPDSWRDLAEGESDIMAQMRDNAADIVDLLGESLRCASAAQGWPGLAGAWRMTGIDPEGCDLARETLTVRQPFQTWVGTVQAARCELVRLAHAAGRADFAFPASQPAR